MNWYMIFKKAAGERVKVVQVVSKQGEMTFSCQKQFQNFQKLGLIFFLFLKSLMSHIYKYIYIDVLIKTEGLAL